jgi:sigma-B regulation protein RsbU (phosphoserine phosphatase)
MARDVQASLLPRPLPQLPGYELAAHWSSAREVAGDFYDVFMLPGEPGQGWGLVVADVSDKGAPAALFMAMTRSLIRSWATRGPAGLLSEVNRALCGHADTNMFVTAFYAALDVEAHGLAYANAGHNPPIVRRRNREMELLTRTGPLLGVFDEARIVEATVALGPGEMLVAYTDGVTEACSPQGEMYGLARLMSAVAASPDGAEAMLERIRADLAAFTAGEPQTDDITLLVLARLPMIGES